MEENRTGVEQGDASAFNKPSKYPLHWLYIISHQSTHYTGYIYSSPGNKYHHIRPVHPHTSYFILTACWTRVVMVLSVVRATLALALFTELATPFLSCGE